MSGLVHTSGQSLIAKFRRAREKQRYRAYVSKPPTDTEELIDRHFATWSEREHINRRGFEIAVSALAGQPQFILETGTSAWGTDSTRLWDSYVRTFGGEFWSVDIDASPSRRLAGQMSSSTHLVVEDSVLFLSRIAEQRGRKEPLGLCYLDSWDLDWNDPDAAALHGLREWRAVEPMLGRGSILMIDDTPSGEAWIPDSALDAARNYRGRTGRWPGKGSLILEELSQRNDVEMLWHGYGVVCRL